jgi:hypothetical protein
LTLGAVLLLAHIAYFYPFMADDAFISLRYAERLLEGEGLTWNDGACVEGYSNLLWVLLDAGLRALGMALPSAVRLLGIGSALLTRIGESPMRSRQHIAYMNELHRGMSWQLQCRGSTVSTLNPYLNLSPALCSWLAVT